MKHCRATLLSSCVSSVPLSAIHLARALSSLFASFLRRRGALLFSLSGRYPVTMASFMRMSIPSLLRRVMFFPHTLGASVTSCNTTTVSSDPQILDSLITLMRAVVSAAHTSIICILLYAPIDRHPFASGNRGLVLACEDLHYNKDPE
ncbi:hypothetical protein GGR58DRAFT_477624 [Xylaria digitata]|nr:hypothetical protein GGR58DRAFT_477624 [Xylaria digitata]